MEREEERKLERQTANSSSTTRPATVIACVSRRISGFRWVKLEPKTDALAGYNRERSEHTEPDVLSNQNKIWDPAEIVEFYSTISAGSWHSNFIKRHLVIVPGQVGVSSRRR